MKNVKIKERKGKERRKEEDIDTEVSGSNKKRGDSGVLRKEKRFYYRLWETCPQGQV